MEKDIALPVNKSEEVAAVAAVHLNAFVAEIRRLFLVEDFLDSAKFAVLLYVLTYIGAWFNGFSLAILGKIFTISPFCLFFFLFLVIAIALNADCD